MVESTSSEMAVTADPESAHAEAAEWYERGITLKKAGLFARAINQLERATGDPQYALKAYAQIGLCNKAIRQYELAVQAFRSAIKSPIASTRETVQLLYVLGRTLESLGRTDEALEAYRWLRREDSRFRDVAQRIEALSSGRSMSRSNLVRTGIPLAKQALQVWEGLLRHTR